MRHNKTILGWMPNGTGTGYPFDVLFDKTINIVTEGIENVDAIVVWGGEDISSSYYGEEPHRYTQNHRGVPSHRDIMEWSAMEYAKIHDIPIIGVCRGAQMLCAFSGGKLIQDVNNHHSTHNVITSDGEVMATSSCHHQMMYPFGVQHEMLAWSEENLSPTYEGENDKSYEDMHQRVEPEVVYFPQTKGLAIQGHPEWMDFNSPFVAYLLNLVNTRLMQEETV